RQGLFGGIKGDRVDVGAAERGQHRTAALERHRSFARRSTHHHRHLAKVHCVSTPTIRTSLISSTPNFSSTASRTRAISLSISDARALPSGLTMKFACFSETRAAP